jgi:ABC-type transport system involved in cytochrome bd biosynthesis fused ATPase/permease subunit
VGAVTPILAAGRLARREGLGRGQAITALAVIERLALPAAAYAFLLDRQATGQALAVLAAALMPLRGIAQRMQVSRNEARLYLRATDAAVHGNVLQESLLPDEDARSGLFEGLHRVARLLGEVIPNLAGNAIVALALGVFITRQMPAALTMVAGVALLAGGAILILTRGWVARAQDASWMAWGGVADSLSDAFDGRVDLVAAGREDDFVHRFQRIVDDWAEKSRRAGWAAGASGRVSALVLVAAVGVAAAAYARWHGLSGYTVALEAAVLASCVPAFLGLGQGLQELAASETRLRLVERVLASRTPVRRGTAAPSSSPSIVECRGISFAHGPGLPLALRHVSLEAQRGQVVVLAGPNGSGKSSVLRAILGLGSLEEGAVVCDDVSLADLDGVRWRQSVSFLPQRPYLPPRATIRQAARFVDHDVTDATIRAALDRVGLVASLGTRGSDPLEMRVGSLSAGERQRVALARALCRQSSVLLLDEPDANLDRDGINLVARLATELAKTRLVIIAAHAPEILAVGDLVVNLEFGSVRSIDRPRRPAIRTG